jgi:hypothetical protein
MISAALQAYSPQNNPDRMFLALSFSGNYGAGGGAGDTLNITPYQSSGNTTGFTDPKNIFAKSIAVNPDVPPGVFAENLVGGYVQAYLGATPETAVLRCFNANGTELTQGAAYPAGFLAGLVILEVLLPERTYS